MRPRHGSAARCARHTWLPACQIARHRFVYPGRSAIGRLSITFIVSWFVSEDLRLTAIGRLRTDAVDELEWAIKNDHRGAVISRMPGGDFDFSAYDDRFFHIASEAQIPLVVHIGSFMRPSVMQSRPNFSFTDLSFLGAVGATKAGSYTIPVTTDLMFSGMFDRFPDIKLALVESNIGWIPTLLEQCDDMFLRYRFFTKAHETMKSETD